MQLLRPAGRYYALEGKLVRSCYHFILIGLFAVSGLLACTQGGSGPMGAPGGGTAAMDEMGAALGGTDGGGNNAAPSQVDMGADVPGGTTDGCPDGPTTMDDNCQQMPTDLAAGPSGDDDEDPDDPETPETPGNFKLNNQLGGEPTKAKLYYHTNHDGEEHDDHLENELKEELQF